MEKDSIRKELLNQLSSLSPEEIQGLSFSLTNQLIKLFNLLPELSSEIGGAYMPLKAEVAPVYQELLRAIPMNLAFPILVNGGMQFGLPNGLPKGNIWMDPPYQIVEPTWLFVPGVGFDEDGARLGRGRGFYDRYLEERENVLTIGLAWSKQVIEKVPVESHDSFMDYIITENFCWDVDQQKRF